METRREAGYSLLELMVVILILAILFSLSVISYVGVRNNGFDTEAKTNLSHGVTAARVYFTGHESSYDQMNAAELEKLAKGIDFRDGTVITDNDVYVSDVTAGGFVMSCRSASGIVFTATGSDLKIEYNF